MVVKLTHRTKTLYVQYTDSGSTKENKTFTLGETLTANNGQTANVISSAAFGIGSRVELAEGIIYAKDHFIKTPAASIIVGEYNSNTANFKVGFNFLYEIAAFEPAGPAPIIKTSYKSVYFCIIY